MKKKILSVSLFLLLGFYLVNLVSAQSVTITPACTTKTQGDANCDSLVDDNDYTLWKNIFLGETLNGISADFNLDTETDLVDFEIWRLNRFAFVASPTSVSTSPTQILTPTKTPTPTPTATPAITACSVCNLLNYNPCGRCRGPGWRCTSRSQTCGNNTKCWTTGTCVERDRER